MDRDLRRKAIKFDRNEAQGYDMVSSNTKTSFPVKDN